MVRTRGQQKAAEETVDAKKEAPLGLYKSMQAAHPIKTDASVAALLSYASVVVSERMTSQAAEVGAALAMAIVAASFITPVLSHYYGWLGKQPWNKLGSLAFDQLIFSPVFTFLLLTYRLLVLTTLQKWASGSLSLAVLHGRLGSAPQEVLPILPDVVRSSWFFWVPCRFIMLNYVPPMYHIVAGNVASFVWNVLLAMLLKQG